LFFFQTNLVNLTSRSTHVVVECTSTMVEMQTCARLKL